MLLPLNEPTSSQALQTITDAAGWILDYVANWSDSIFDKQNFQTYLRDRGLFDLINTRSNIAKCLPTLLTLPQDERKRLRDAFYNDASFCKHLDNPDYVFLFLSLREETRAVGKTFLLYFYERLASSGFHDRTEGHTFSITRMDVEQGYRDANEGMAGLCPACLELLEKATSKTSLVDCEHFFPRSLYPPLIVHPNNLVFVCKACNHYHNNDDPINPLDISESGGLRKTFVPYRRSGLVSKMQRDQKADEVILQFDIANPQQKFVTLVGNGNEVFSFDRATNFDRVYGLSKRWGVLVPDMYDELCESVRNNLASRGEAFTRQNIEKQLQIEFKTHDYFSHRTNGAYLRSQYVQWIQQNCLEPLVRELTS